MRPAVSILSRHSLHAIFGLDDTLMSSLTDDELLALGNQWAALHAERAAHLNCLTMAEERFHAIEPQRPDALLKTEDDVRLGLSAPLEQVASKVWGSDLIDGLRTRPRTRRVQYAVTDQRLLSEGVEVVERREPWLEAQIRANEIVKVWDDWTASIEQARRESGLAAAEAKDSELYDRLEELEDKISRMSAVSLAGLLLKARIGAAYSCVQEDGVTPGLEERLTRAIEAKTDRDDICALSILRDLYTIGVLAA